MNQKNVASQRYFHLLLIFMGILGIALVFIATRWGAALSDDSYFYIKPARDMLSGQPFQLNSHYTPMLPFLLAGIGLTGLDPQEGIRYLNALCFGVNIFLAGVLVRKITGREGFGLAAGLLFLLAQPLIEVHAWAMSEAFFIFLILLCFYLLMRYFESQHIKLLMLSAIVAGLAALTRYAGVAMIAAGSLGVLLTGYGRWRDKVGRAFLFGGISGLLFLIYPISLLSVRSELSGFGGLQFGVPGENAIKELFYNTLLWFVPGRLVRGRETLGMIALIVIAVILCSFILFITKTKLANLMEKTGQNPGLLLLALFIVFSLFVLYQANLSESYRSPYDFRLLSPTHVAMLLLFLSVIGVGWGRFYPWLRIGVAVLGVLAVGLYAQRAFDTVKLYYERGMGFASVYWHEADVIAFLKSVPETTPVVSTAPMGVYFSTEKETKGIYGFTPDQLVEYLHDNDGYFVLFESMPFDIYGLDQGSYVSQLTLVRAYSNSFVYNAP